ncbi:GNAT family N-acetyltransferase [Marinobacteraceae bacterium S3BR75-40.1]
MSEYRARLLTRMELPLANKFYRQHQPQMRAHGDEQVWLLKERETVGAVRLKPVENGHWLTGLFIHPEHRGKGLARELLQTVLLHHGGPVWLFCEPGLNALYERVGFAPAASLPAALAQRLEGYRRHQTLVALAYEAS